ncbi:TIGR04282 family arsenosugar biosynthesis glycosyltransferase [Botrimarina colliarenosi]|uniref:TIGR04282 family arsenosugar biosynthesis glycosyltransferase n=1 Tax=Botrimarina colliarenosi TaxID=2528001 RepID=UPI0018D3589B|nr:TIGR04282 family arsenosugar biosynthesis glycosyltransferase [Botrimarina colliarenosi]
MAKHWTPGKSKTRLAATIGAAKAAELSHAFLETTLQRLATLSAGRHDLVLAYSPATRREEFEELAAVRRGEWRCVPQSQGTLGERMRAFFANHPTAILLGSDSPHLPAESVQSAMAWLGESGDARRFVIGPSDDGGYWLIGVRGRTPPIFDAMPWSEATLYATTLKRLEAAGWREGHDYRAVDSWYDIDTSDDLARLRAMIGGGDDALRELGARIDRLVGLSLPSDPPV